MPTLTTRAGQVSYEERGTGSPILLLHATLHDRHDYDAVIPALAEHRRVIAVDWPGHGESPTPSTEVTGPLLADVLEDVVDGLGLSRPVVIGNSVGGYAASRLAISRPDDVAGVVLVNAAGFTPSSPFTRTFCRTLGRPRVARAVLPRLVPRYMRPRTDFDQDVTDRAVERARSPQGWSVGASLWRSFALAEYDLRARASEHRAPTLFVWGTRDVVLNARAGRHAHRQLPNAQYHTIDTGHVVFASDPDAFLGFVLPFLDTIDRTAGMVHDA